MKKIQTISALVIFGLCSHAVMSNEPGTFTKEITAVAGYFDVYLKNNCSKEVEVRVRADGSSSVSKYKAGEKVKVPAKAGYEIYVDGTLFLKLEESHSGKEINLCK